MPHGSISGMYVGGSRDLLIRTEAEIEAANTYRVQVTYVVFMLVEFGGLMIVVMVPGAQFKDVRKSGEEEQKHLQNQFFGRAIADEER